MNHLTLLPALLLTVVLLMLHAGAQPVAADSATTSFNDKYQAGQAQQLAEQYAQAQAAFEAALLAATNASEVVQAHLGIAAAQAAQKNITAAKAELTKALAVPDASHDVLGQALIALADLHAKQYQWLPAATALNKALALENLSGVMQYKAHMSLANIYTNYGNWTNVKAACLAALSTSGYTLEQKVGAQKLLAKALVNLREYADARAVMRQMLAGDADQVNADDQPIPRVVLDEYIAGKMLPVTQRAHLQMAISKTLIAERNFAEARTEFLHAMSMPGMTNALRAEAQLYVGLSYYEAGDNLHATPELLKVLDMPDAYARPAWDGGRMGYVPAREASLRLQFRNLLPDAPPTLKVLFIGSSHTLRQNMPQLVTQIAASAPDDQPRILAGDYIYMGTNIATFWNAGDAPDTVRGIIASEPWDVVVFETFYNMKLQDLTKYVTLFTELIRSRGATPVIYESPIAKASPYPDRFQQFHDDNLAVSRQLQVALAPGVAAWMQRLGSNPTAEQFGEVYADWIHASERGAYINATCIYAAITGRNPAGLYHPTELSNDDAVSLQAVAWKAYSESNLVAKPDASTQPAASPDTTDITLP